MPSEDRAGAAKRRAWPLHPGHLLVLEWDSCPRPSAHSGLGLGIHPSSLPQPEEPGLQEASASLDRQHPTSSMAPKAGLAPCLGSLLPRHTQGSWQMLYVGCPDDTVPYLAAPSLESSSSSHTLTSAPTLFPAAPPCSVTILSVILQSWLPCAWPQWPRRQNSWEPGSYEQVYMGQNWRGDFYSPVGDVAVCMCKREYDLGATLRTEEEALRIQHQLPSSAGMCEERDKHLQPQHLVKPEASLEWTWPELDQTDLLTPGHWIPWPSLPRALQRL